MNHIAAEDEAQTGKALTEPLRHQSLELEPGFQASVTIRRALFIRS